MSTKTPDQICRDAGMDLYHTGGGCMAWRMGLPNNCYILATDPEDAYTPSDDCTHVAVGFYSDDDGECLPHPLLALFPMSPNCGHECPVGDIPVDKLAEVLGAFAASQVPV